MYAYNVHTRTYANVLRICSKIQYEEKVHIETYG